MSDQHKTTEAERLAGELVAGFPCAEHGGSDAALCLGSVAVDASVLMEAAAELRRLGCVPGANPGVKSGFEDVSPEAVPNAAARSGGVSATLDAAQQGAPRMPWRDRLVAWIGAWALRRLYGACPPDDFDPDCPSCKSGYLIREMEDIARGR